MASKSAKSSSTPPSPPSPLTLVEETKDGGLTTTSQMCLFEKANVYVHPSEDSVDRVSGKLSLVKEDGGRVPLLTWTPYTLLNNDFVFVNSEQQQQHYPSHEENEPRTTPVACNTPGTSTSVIPASSQEVDHDHATLNVSGDLLRPLNPDMPSLKDLYAIRVSLSEVHSIHRHVPTLGFQHIVVILRGGVGLPPLYFHSGGVRDLFHAVKEHVNLTRFEDDPNLYFINDTSDPLQRSLQSQDLGDALREVPPRRYSTEVRPATRPPSMPMSPPLSVDARRRRESTPKGAEDVAWNVLERFSRVTQFARDTANNLILSAKKQTKTAPLAGVVSDFIDIGNHIFSPQKRNSGDSTQEPPQVNHYEVIIRTEDYMRAVSELGLRRGNALSQEDWLNLMDEEGRVRDQVALRRFIFYGGMEDSVRPVVWKFLLGLHSYNSTYAEREEINTKKKEEYRALKNQWMSISAAQEARFAKFRERRSRVEKDVLRTDRHHPFFEGEDNANLNILNDILLTYSFYNFDIGYCQGMSDLAGPILSVIQDEELSFWCFACLMDVMEKNFHKDQSGMHTQLLQLGLLIKILDRELYDHLEKHNCLNFFFCFRWLLILFKREFDFHTTLKLWETLWSHFLSRNFHLYVALAILVKHRDAFLDNDMEFDDILKFVNELSGNIDLNETLIHAEALYMRMRESCEDELRDHSLL